MKRLTIRILEHSTMCIQICAVSLLWKMWPFSWQKKKIDFQMLFSSKATNDMLQKKIRVAVHRQWHKQMTFNCEPKLQPQQEHTKRQTYILLDHHHQSAFNRITFPCWLKWNVHTSNVGKKRKFIWIEIQSNREIKNWKIRRWYKHILMNQKKNNSEFQFWDQHQWNVSSFFLKIAHSLFWIRFK